MPNFAQVLKEEICRLARREIRSSTGVLRRQSAQFRRDIAALKRLTQQLDKHVGFLKAQERERVAQPQVSETVARKARFSAKWLAKHRGKLSLSADDYARLVGVTGQSIYMWERGRSKPRARQLAALVAIRSVGPREARHRLELIEGARKGGEKPVARKRILAVKAKAKKTGRPAKKRKGKR
jgi:DNA-binding transcriptional regulator YiaG